MNTLDQIQDKIEQIESLIQDLRLKSAVKNQLVRHLNDVLEEIEDAVEVQPTDWD